MIRTLREKKIEQVSSDTTRKEVQELIKGVFQDLAEMQSLITQYTGELIYYDESLNHKHFVESDEGEQLLKTIQKYKNAINRRLSRLEELTVPLDVEKAESYTNWIYEDFPPSKVYSIRANIFNKNTTFDAISDLAEKKTIFQACLDYSRIIAKINKVFSSHNKIENVEKISLMTTYDAWTNHKKIGNKHETHTP